MSDRPTINRLMNREGFEARALELGITPQELWRQMETGQHEDWRPERMRMSFGCETCQGSGSLDRGSLGRPKCWACNGQGKIIRTAS